MYINKPSATKTEAADRVNLLHSTIYRFEQWERATETETEGVLMLALTRTDVDFEWKQE